MRGRSVALGCGGLVCVGLGASAALLAMEYVPALGGVRSAAPPEVEALQAEEPAERDAAAEALEASRETTVRGLLAVARDASLGREVGGARHLAIEALGRWRASEAVPFLVDHVDLELEGVGAEASRPERYPCYAALQGIGLGRREILDGLEEPASETKHELLLLLVLRDLDRDTRGLPTGPVARSEPAPAATPDEREEPESEGTPAEESEAADGEESEEADDEEPSSDTDDEPAVAEASDETEGDDSDGETTATDGGAPEDDGGGAAEEAVAGVGPPEPVRSFDRSKIVDATQCTACHTGETRAWKNTHHYDTYDTLHRRDEAREIADELGIRSLKRDSLCLDCHYTVEQEPGGSPKAVAGISCQSCHMPAEDWVNVHPRPTSSAAERKEKMDRCFELGMYHNGELYHLASRCYGCHLVPNERLVAEGGHEAGSDFELVSWSQGEVRHNFFESNGEENERASPERLRVLYVLGQLLELEYSLRATAKATRVNVYTRTMARRVVSAREKLAATQEVLESAGVGLSEITQALEVAHAVALETKNEGPLSGAADTVRALAQRFVDEHDGGELGVLDSKVPSPDEYKGTPTQ